MNQNDMDWDKIRRKLMDIRDSLQTCSSSLSMALRSFQDLLNELQPRAAGRGRGRRPTPAIPGSQPGSQSGSSEGDEE